MTNFESNLTDQLNKLNRNIEFVNKKTKNSDAGGIICHPGLNQTDKRKKHQPRKEVKFLIEEDPM